MSKEERSANDLRRITRLCQQLYPIFLGIKYEGRRALMMARLPYEPEIAPMGFVLDEIMDRSEKTFPIPGVARSIEKIIKDYKPEEEVPMLVVTFGPDKEAVLKVFRFEHPANPLQGKMLSVRPLTDAGYLLVNNRSVESGSTESAIQQAHLVVQQAMQIMQDKLAKNSADSSSAPPVPPASPPPSAPTAPAQAPPVPPASANTPPASVPDMDSYIESLLDDA